MLRRTLHLRIEILSKKLRVRHVLTQCRAASMSRAEFKQICASNEMSSEEATELLVAFHKARVVVSDEDRVYVRPAEIINRIHQHLQVPQLSLSTAEHINFQRDQNAISQVTEATSLWRKRFWSAIAVGSGVQMSVLSYLTFITFGWDIMEPVCYFVTCTTSIAFYVYFLLFRREQSLQQVDENFLPVILERRCAEAGVNSKKWIENFEREEHDRNERSLHQVEDLQLVAGILEQHSKKMDGKP